MKKKRLLKKLKKVCDKLNIAEKVVKEYQNERKEIMAQLSDADVSVKEISEVSSLTRQMVYKIIGKKK